MSKNPPLHDMLHLIVPEKVLALDPGYSRFGWAIWVDAEPHTWAATARSMAAWVRALPPHLIRAHMINRVLCNGPCEEVLQDPNTMVVMESTQGLVHPGKPAKGLESAAWMQGHVESFFAARPNPFFSVTRREWSRGRSDELIVQEMNIRCAMELNQDTADANAIAAWFCSHKWLALRADAQTTRGKSKAQKKEMKK